MKNTYNKLSIYNIIQKVLLIYEKVLYHSNDLSILRCYTWLQNILTMLSSHTLTLLNLVVVGH